MLSRWRDAYAIVVITLAIVAVFAAFVGVIVFGLVKPLSEMDCNQRGDELGAKHSDYRVWSDTCYLTTPSGQVVAADNYRYVEQGAGFK